MTKLALVLHFYQPPTQSINLTAEILKSCYLPLCDLLLQTPNAKATLNLSGSLLIQTQTIPGHDFATKIKRLHSQGKVEFTTSPIYHPISPLTKPDVLRRQLDENKQLLDNFCGVSDFAAIFPPELAVDATTIKELQSYNLPFLVDESSINMDFNIGKIHEQAVFTFESTKLFVNSRSLTELVRSYPIELNANNFVTFLLKDQVSHSRSLICTTDAEVFGHHYQERINFLRDLFNDTSIEFIKLSDIKDAGSNLDTLHASTWQTTGANLKANNPYPYWLDPTNDLQKRYYKLAAMTYEAVNEVRFMNVPTHILHTAETRFDQGISSCHPYWLSNIPWWHPDMVEEGARLLVKAVRTVPIENHRKQKIERFYHEFLMDMWHHHWSGEVERKYLDFDKTRLEFLKTLPRI